MGCGVDEVVAAFHRVAEVITAHRDELVDLDRAIGDGDHGENLTRGFTAVRASLDEGEHGSPAEVLKLVASTLISTVGGAAGPLYGTALLRAAKAVPDRVELGPEDVAAALAAALEGVVARGRAEAGDKTMVDALVPAVAAAERAVGDGGDTRAVLAAASAAAETGARETAPLVARKGRASYLGERSAGHLDPGARSTALVLGAFASPGPSPRRTPGKECEG
ncbi:dihydroxyacetone kinase subunit L [Actinoalloteichus sp. AHMU CJ021]|uniref:dihydroxyacetone kinase subunit DhaL n=1 Tax=Actinoalloteichus sp. AHMU CJ021 TaxID=2072503 RepID=UPI000CA089BC|nr:dihydroxyacetone kinase subunit L [Actinoalloteichus sp. AHMU CJ021]